MKLFVTFYNDDLEGCGDSRLLVLDEICPTFGWDLDDRKKAEKMELFETVNFSEVHNVCYLRRVA